MPTSQPRGAGGPPPGSTTLERRAAAPAGPSTAERPATRPQQQPSRNGEGDYDVAIIGGGPGGYVAAIRGAQLGLRVALIEKEFLGGTCLNVGCIPTKVMLSSVEALETARRGAEFGFSAGEVNPDYPVMLQRRDKIVKQLRSGVEQLLKARKVTLYEGFASFVKPQELEVKGAGEPQRVRARNVIIATGSVPAAPPIPGAELPGVVNSDGLLELKEAPKRLGVVGAGAVGLEWAGIYQPLGTEIVVFEMVDQILPPADAEIAGELAKILRRRGYAIHTSAMVQGIEQSGKALKVRFSTPTKGEQDAEVDVVLLATGRWPNTEGLGLDGIGISLERRAIPVNEKMQTRVSGVYAIGDVVPGPQLAHLASREGEVAVEVIAGENSRIDYRAVPSGVYTHPEVAWVGVTEEEARETDPEAKVGKFPFRVMGRALAAGARDGFVKVIAGSRYGEIVGVHMLGAHVTDLIAEATLAMSMEGTVDDVIHAIHAHPTMAEPLMEASLDVWNRAIHKP